MSPRASELEQIDHARAVGKPEHLPHGIGAHHACRMRDRLIEQRQRIAHRAFGRAGDNAERLGLDLDVFLCRDPGKMAHQHVGIHPAKVETLTTRQHRHRHLADFRGGEHEFGVLRRLFQRLEKRVECRGREHVDFVDDVHLVTGAGRRIPHAVVDLAHVVDAGMGGGIHLQHVHVPAFHDRLAMHARHRHMDGGPCHRAVRQLVVQRAGENPRGGRFTDPAHAGQNPGLRNPSGLERIRNRAHHRVLADQVLEAGGPVFARQHAIMLAGLGRAAEVETGLTEAIGIVGGRRGSASVGHRSIRT